MTEIGTAPLVLIAALWARENARSSGFERVNKIRDLIVFGKIDGNKIDLSHRKHMFASD